MRVEEGSIGLCAINLDEARSTFCVGNKASERDGSQRSFIVFNLALNILRHRAKSPIAPFYSTFAGTCSRQARQNFTESRVLWLLNSCYYLNTSFHTSLGRAHTVGGRRLESVRYVMDARTVQFKTAAVVRRCFCIVFGCTFICVSVFVSELFEEADRTRFHRPRI